MRVRPWEVWKARPPGFETDHWFVIISGQERCDEPRHLCVNGLACFTHRGRLGKTEVQLNGADGFTAHQEALGALYLSVQQQAAVLAYADIFRLLGYLSLLCIPLALLLHTLKHSSRRSAAGRDE